MIKSLMTLPALLFAGVAFVILFPILGVTLWVSLLAAGVSALAYALTAGILLVRSGPDGHDGDAIRMNPVVDVALLRGRYLLTMAIAALAGFLVVETFAFAASTSQTIGFAVGIALTIGGLGLLVLHGSRPGRQLIGLPWRGLSLAAWEAIALLTMTIGAWQVVQTLVFGAGTSHWLSFANGCGVLGLATAALVLHELSTERVVHALEVIDSRSNGQPTAPREPEHAHA